MGKLHSWTKAVRHQVAPILSGRTAKQGKCWIRAGAGALADLVFPPTCLLCSSDMYSGSTRLCQQCCQDLLSAPRSCCPRCAKPVPDGTQADENGCALCLHKVLRFRRTIAIGIYGGPVRDLVLRMKQSRNESLSLAAGSLLSQRVEQILLSSLPDVVAPVPMHWLRRLSRGVNAAEIVAESVAKRLHRPLYVNLLRCRRKTRKQGTLLPSERRKNVRGAYAIFRHAPLQGAHVLLVDDVMTTGATANELAKIMMRGGAREVSIAVIARGVGFD